MNDSIVIHRADTRETVNFPFMQAFHSFRPHYAETRKHFGALVAIDDATVKPASKGFGFHPHNNLEVITFLTEGEVIHEDANVPEHNGVLTARACQLITSGSGIVHNERNNSSTEQFRGLQIWILPRANELPPSYSKKQLAESDYTDQLQLVISPDGESGSLLIQQDAYLHYGLFHKPRSLEYRKNLADNMIYCYVYRGEVESQGTVLKEGDAVGLRDTDVLHLEIGKGTEVLIFEVPEMSKSNS